MALGNFFSTAMPFLMFASAGVSAMSQVRQGKAAEASAQFNAQVAEQNAQVARAEAVEFARMQDRETYLRLGSIRAAQGASGGSAAEGSVLDYLADVTAESERERVNILWAGELKARGYDNTALLDRLEGRSARSTSYLRAGSDLLSGISSGILAGSRLDRTR